MYRPNLQVPTVALEVLEMSLITVPRAAALLGLRERRIYQLARDGLIPSVRIGRQLRFDEDALRQWIAAGGQALPGGWRRRSPDCPRTDQCRNHPEGTTMLNLADVSGKDAEG